MNIGSVMTATTDVLAQAALAAEAETVRTQTESAAADRLSRRAELADRMSQLDAGRRELLRSADKALAGGLVSASMSFAAAGCQAYAASQSFAAADAARDAVDLQSRAALATGDEARSLSLAAKSLDATSNVCAATSKGWEAEATACTAGGKLGDVYGQSGAYNQAAKLVFDKQAEVAQTRAQDDDQRANDARALRDRELARMKDVVDTVRQTALAALRP
jgi:hypothetical protein